MRSFPPPMSMPPGMSMPQGGPSPLPPLNIPPMISGKDPMGPDDDMEPPPFPTAASMPAAAKKLPAAAGKIFRDAANAKAEELDDAEGPELPGDPVKKEAADEAAELKQAVQAGWDAVAAAGYRKDGTGTWVKVKGRMRP